VNRFAGKLTNSTQSFPNHESSAKQLISKMKRLIFILVFILAIPILLPSLGFGAEAASSVSKQITMSVDADLISFVKTTISLGSIFLVIFAVLGVTFFGWDVRKARGSIIDAQNEAKELLKDLREDYEALKGLKEKLEELGSKLQEDSEPLQDLKEKHEGIGAKPQEGTRTPIPSAGSATLSGEAALTAVGLVSGTRSNLQLIREVINSSNYEWTTIGRIMKKTGIAHDDILREAQSAPDIIINYGPQTKDFIFKFDPIKAASNPVLRDIYPLPESLVAIARGCKCTTLKDANGIPVRGTDGKLLYSFEKGCPVHP
jgi:hypothetical protein